MRLKFLTGLFSVSLFSATAYSGESFSSIPKLTPKTEVNEILSIKAKGMSTNVIYDSGVIYIPQEELVETSKIYLTQDDLPGCALRAHRVDYVDAYYQLQATIRIAGTSNFVIPSDGLRGVRLFLSNAGSSLATCRVRIFSDNEQSGNNSPTDDWLDWQDHSTLNVAGVESKPIETFGPYELDAPIDGFRFIIPWECGDIELYDALIKQHGQRLELNPGDFTSQYVDTDKVYTLWFNRGAQSIDKIYVKFKSKLESCQVKLQVAYY